MKSSHLFSVGSAFLGLLLALAAPARANLIVDGGFESATGSWSMGSNVASGWSTTAGDHNMEIWSSGLYNVPAYEGNYFMEINANQIATVYQDVTGIEAGSLLDLSFAHRGRVTEESMRVTLTGLGADGIYGTADDIVLYTGIYTDGTSAWSDYNISVTDAEGGTVRVSFASLVAGSYGNFIDAVSLTATAAVAAAPEPGTWATLALLVCGSYGSLAFRRRRACGCPAR